MQETVLLSYISKFCSFQLLTFYKTLIKYRVSQEECARLRESVPYVKVYRYNPKHLCPKLNGCGDNGQRSLKLWQLLTHLLITKYILKLAGNVVSVMLITVLNIKLTCEWHKAIKLNYKNTRTHVIVVLRVTSTIHEKAPRWRNMADCAKRHAGTVNTAFPSQGR